MAPQQRRDALANLVGADLRGRDLTEADLRDADLRGACLAGMALHATDLSGADLSGADLSGVRMTGGSLRGARLDGSRWDRAAIVGTDGVGDAKDRPELAAAAVAGRDVAEVMLMPTDPPHCAAFSPDGVLLAVGAGSAVLLIDAATWTTLRVLRGHAAHVGDLAFSPDGTLLASGAFYGTARIWDTATGELRSTLTVSGAGVESIAFSPDGSTLTTLSRSFRESFRETWEPRTGSRLSRIRVTVGSMFPPRLSPDGTGYATAVQVLSDESPQEWVTSDGAQVTYPSPSYQLIIGDASEGVRRYDLPAQPRTALLGMRYRSLAYSPDGAFIAWATKNGSVRACDVATGRERALLPEPCTGFIFSPDGALIATEGEPGTSIWDVATGERRLTLASDGGPVLPLAFSLDASLIVVASDGALQARDAATGELRAALEKGRPVPRTVAFSPDGALLAAGHYGGSTRVWSTVTCKQLHALDALGGNVRQVAFSPDGAFLATTVDERDGSPRPASAVWDLATGARRWDLGRVGAVAYSPDGTRLVTDGDIGYRMLDAGTGRELRRMRRSDAFRRGSLRRFWKGIPVEQQAAVRQSLRWAGDKALSPDGTRIVTRVEDHAAQICGQPRQRPSSALRRKRREGSEPVATLKGHDGRVEAVAYSPDGTLIATGSADRTARLWDAATGAHRITLTGHDAAVQGVAFSPDSATVATASADGTVRLWSASTGAVVATLIGLGDGGYATFFADGRHQVNAPGGGIWWAIKTCRFAPGELDPYIQGP